MTEGTAFGRWLTTELNRRGISQSEFARMIDANTAMVNRWCRGVYVPRPYWVEAIAEALNVDGDRLLVLANHRRNREELPEDDPRYHVVEKVLTVRWTDERERLLESMLNNMIEIDISQDKVSNTTPQVGQVMGR